MAIKKFVVAQIAKDLKEALHGRGNLTPEDEKYVVDNLDNITDQRLKECVGQLLGWDDVQKGKIETAMSIFIELCKLSSASKLSMAARNAEVRYHMHYTIEGKDDGKTP